MRAASVCRSLPVLWEQKPEAFRFLFLFYKTIKSKKLVCLKQLECEDISCVRKAGVDAENHFLDGTSYAVAGRHTNADTFQHYHTLPLKTMHFYLTKCSFILGYLANLSYKLVKD